MAIKYEIHCGIAKKCGVHAALLMNYIRIETIENDYAFNTQAHSWKRISEKDFMEQFPFMSSRQISYAIKKLIDDNLIITGNFNESKFDKTLWYSLTDYGFNVFYGYTDIK